ncbi:hypothetical protein HQ305_03100 [Rhodococcus sp. BP-149]|uniref:Rv1733c family protein n=1 Tax=unclassified Rhodococcus (in: high G+C Gram-positive bacteria) TaxID=192944 RepID=UPI001C9A8520|nr:MULTISPECIES: hypothetical protein [unclassified Rhodococcus (in: high G+C Gram-positive bacteria)]MBY6684592.1 hypothetical protein [Rhodococcus sp. BP-288]MBY6695441.1 hypothetical protein [Rhodococcus sp. BP-188]MBY6698822.1 hypothetical protein [Rhodococcus sp. BP-285]MBY6701501.1 hypothetical protein [Rhodococcus sp. BP-283]MBY6712502.1 hypothetical protein [Rhodococcus sp. BP-160]
MADNSKRAERGTDDTRRPVARTPRNPLVRGVDRAEARLHRLLVTLFLLAVPFVAVMGVSLYHDQQTMAADAVTSSSSVLATTTADAVAPVASDEFAAVTPTVLAPATWSSDGVKHVGSVPVAAQSPSGTEVTITVDGDGRRIAPPPTGVDVVVVSIFGAAALLALVAIVLVIVRSVFARVYDRRRDREWDDAIARFLS